MAVKREEFKHSLGVTNPYIHSVDRQSFRSYDVIVKSHTWVFKIEAVRANNFYASFNFIPPQQSGSLTFNPVDDAYIANSSPTSNFGSATTLQVDNSPVKHFLLKFDVTGVGSQTITNAKIRLYNTDAASEGGDFYHVSDDSWQEETVTWNNAPTADTTLLASLGSVSANTWYEVDVTSLITGDGTYSFRISDSVGGADYSSKEGANDPELVLTLGGTPAATNTPTLTATPGPSPTPTNTLTPTATFVLSPTPILPLFSNAAFTYDGDGKRVKSVITTNIATTTTYFVGAHYEVADGVVTKYYYAGSQRIALRVNGTLNYLVGDHLGSTSLTTDANGTVISELRYTAWGEVRYSSGDTLTKYQYTGQYSDSYINLLWYGSRHYDPELGRFISPDSIVPTSVQGVQAYDRYAYVSNNPIRYTDSTGHMIDVGEGAGCGSECRREQIFKMHNWLQTLAKKNVIKDLEALARLTEYAAVVSENCTRCFINDLGATLTGHAGDDGRTAAYRELLRQLRWPGIEYHQNYRDIRNNQLMQTGYADVFQDPAYETEGVGGNQAHHYWFYVQVGYESGFYSGVIGDVAHEVAAANDRRGMSYEDYALGVEGSQLGAALSLGVIEPSEVGDYIRQTLSPGSYTAMYWTYPIMPIFP